MFTMILIKHYYLVVKCVRPEVCVLSNLCFSISIYKKSLICLLNLLWVYLSNC